MTISEVKRMARVTEWKSLIQEQKQSGLSIKEWCEQNGFRENAYYYWLKIIRTEAIEQVEKNAALALLCTGGGIERLLRSNIRERFLRGCGGSLCECAD